MSRFEKFILVNEYTLPYDGTHINHTTSIAHIKKVYGNTYKVDADGTNAWAVFAKMADEWIPVTTPFTEKETADKFMKWLNSAEKDQKDMLGTISDKKPYIYPKATMAEGQNPKDYTDADWIVYDEASGDVVKYIKKTKTKAQNIARHFTSSKGQAGAEIGYAKKHLKWLIKGL